MYYHLLPIITVKQICLYLDSNIDRISLILSNKLWYQEREKIFTYSIEMNVRLNEYFLKNQQSVKLPMFKNIYHTFIKELVINDKVKEKENNNKIINQSKYKYRFLAKHPKDLLNEQMVANVDKLEIEFPDDTIYNFTASSFSLFKSLKHLFIRRMYGDIEPGSLPSTLRKVCFSGNVTLNETESLAPGVIPDGVRSVKIYSDFYYDLEKGTFPSSVKSLTLLCGLGIGLIKDQLLPPNLEKLIMVPQNATLRPSDFPGTIKKLHLLRCLRPLHDNSPPILPDSITELYLNEYPYSIKSSGLPSQLLKLTLRNTKEIVDLPDSIEFLQISSTYTATLPDRLPNRLKRLEIETYYQNTIPSLPTSLNYLVLGYDYRFLIPNRTSYDNNNNNTQQIEPLIVEFDFRSQSLSQFKSFIGGMLFKYLLMEYDGMAYVKVLYRYENNLTFHFKRIDKDLIFIFTEQMNGGFIESNKLFTQGGTLLTNLYKNI